MGCKAFYVFTTVIITLGCTKQNPVSTQTLKEELESADPHKALAVANNMRNTEDSIQSQLTSESIVFTISEDESFSVPLPSDTMAIALAPYLTFTHTCQIHSISGCQGEMPNKNFNIRAIDEAGTTILNESMQSLSNGFLELWLPRGHEITVTVEADGKSATGIIGTFIKSNTCVTTFQLQ